MADAALVRLSLAEAADGIRRRALSPVALIEAVLAQIDAFNPALNAFTTLVPRAQVLAAARAAEREIAAGAYRGLLHGIPVSVKDLIDTAGLRTTYGSGMFRDHVPERDGGVPERLRARHTAGVARFLQGGGSTILGKRIEMDALRRDGTEIKVGLKVTALRRRSGYVFNAFVQDFPEKRALDEQLRMSQKMEAIGQLTGGVAHDFNNMLTVITGTIEILAEGVANDPKLAATVKLIDEAATRGVEMTQRLLAFARKQPLQPYSTDVNTLLVDAAKLLRQTLGEQIEIESILQDELPPVLVDCQPAHDRFAEPGAECAGRHALWRQAHARDVRRVSR